MNEFWKVFLEDSEGCFNVRVVCSDGIIQSHKIIIASASKFIKNILQSIPFADDVTLYLPDFQKVEVETFLLLKESFDIFAVQSDDFIDVSQVLIKEVKEEFEDEHDYGSMESEYKIKSNKEYNSVKEEESSKDNIANIPITEKVNKKTPKSAKRKSREMVRMEVARNKLKYQELRAAYEEAKAYYSSGKCISYRKVAEMFNVNHATLQKLVRTGQSYVGHWTLTSTFLTEQEERMIAESIVDKVEKEGLEFHTKILRQMVKEEIIQLNLERPRVKDVLNSVGKFHYHVEQFASKYNLERLYTKYNKNISFESTEEANDYATNVDELKEDNFDRRDKCREFCTKVALENGRFDYLNGDCSKEIEEISKDFIQDPKNPTELRKNKHLETKIAMEKAKTSYLSGESESLREAARKFGVNHATLDKCLKSGKSFQGHHKATQILTDDEEKMIVNRIIEKINGDQILTAEIVREVIREELEIIKINFPERSDRIQKMMNVYFKSYARTFALKHRLNKYFPEDTRERNWECDICLKRFTFKNCLVKHQKAVHYSFLS